MSQRNDPGGPAAGFTRIKKGDQFCYSAQGESSDFGNNVFWACHFQIYDAGDALVKAALRAQTFE
jgi:hypothetical protein